MQVLDAFAGIGGFSLGFHQAGFQTRMLIEQDPTCIALLNRQFPGVPLVENVKEAEGGRLRPLDVITGGFPCQDVSIAGRRAGLAGSRSGLFYEFARLIDEASPEWVVIENVTGLLSSGGRRDMGAVLGTLAELGYGFAYRVLDAQYFGVAQRRRRVFIVGRAGGDIDGPRQVLLESQGVRRDSHARRKAGSIVTTLTANSLGGCGPDDSIAQAGYLRPAVVRLRAGKPGGGKGALVRENQSLTIATGNDQTLFQPAVGTLAVRKLMPLECERLQGFPDGWTEGFSDTARYRMLGNAVCVPVVRWLAQRISSFDSSSSLRTSAAPSVPS